MFATPSVYMQVADAPAAAVARPAPSPAPASAAGARPEGEEAVRHPLSPAVRAVLALNPMTGLIGAFRAAVLGGPIPWGNLAASSACAVMAFLAGCFYFRRVEDAFADII
jgi:lipopolysaccharide transport system permease protein